jgi:hypothetical protein
VGSIIAIDPGHTTGVAIATNVHGTEYAAQAGIVVWDNRHWFYRYLAEKHDQIDQIVIERFRLFNNQKTMNAQINSEFPSVRIIGIVECAAYAFGLLEKITYQDPAQRKDVRIPIEHHAAVGQSDHAKDAYRHLRYYILTHKGAK